jgi:hypothetical protein
MESILADAIEKVECSIFGADAEWYVPYGIKPVTVKFAYSRFSCRQ